MSQTCGQCADGWICEEHPDKPWPHDDCAGPGVPCENPACEFSIVRAGLLSPRIRYDPDADASARGVQVCGVWLSLARGSTPGRCRYLAR